MTIEILVKLLVSFSIIVFNMKLLVILFIIKLIAQINTGIVKQELFRFQNKKENF